jgi:hypothetical protein
MCLNADLCNYRVPVTAAASVPVSAQQSVDGGAGGKIVTDVLFVN